MPKAKPDPELVAQARELVAMGASLREAAHTLGVSPPTIKRWIESEPERPAPSQAALPAHMKPPEAPIIVELDMSDPRKMVEQLIAELWATIQVNRAAGDSRQTASLASNVAKLVVSMRQFAEQEKSSADGISVSPGDFAAACADLDAKLAARVERGGVIRCADCERALSVALGLGPSATDADEATLAKDA